MMTEEQRRFEQWVVGIYHTRLLKDEKGNYRGQVLQQLWQAWQAALTQPASPAYFINRIEFTDAYGPDVELRVYESELDASKSKEDHGGDVIPVYLNAPHTAPIEPICVTVGAEWVKCSERMPEIGSTILIHMQDPIHSATPYAVATYDKYGFSRSKVTHWMPLPAAPEEK